MSVRRTSMFLRRSKSGDFGKGGRKQQQLREQEQRPVPKSPPRLPLGSLGGDVRPDSLAIVSGEADDYQPQQPQQAQRQQSQKRYPSSGRPSMDPGRPSVSSNPPVPPIPKEAAVEDPYARAESMTNRGRYSYASSAAAAPAVNNPRRVRRRKDPTPFNVLVMGTRGSGKTSFLEFMKSALALPPKKRSHRATEIGDEFTSAATASGSFIPHYVESEIEGERIGITLWDSEGLEKNVVDLQLREMSTFLESKFEDTFAEEMKVMRSPGAQDTHIHAVFLILDPARLDRNIAATKTSTSNGVHGKQDPLRVVGGLDEDLDLQVLRTLQGKTTVIPVISKADTITTAHMAVLKRTVWASLKKSDFDPLQPLGLDDDEDSTPDSSRIDEEEQEEEKSSESGDDSDDGTGVDSDGLPIQGLTTRPKTASNSSARRAKPAEEVVEETPLLPMSIISPDMYEPNVVGRKFPWGFANPYNEEHCDFTKLRDAVFNEWRGDLREASRDQWYEGWRTSRLKHRESSRVRRF